jgi:hypothetical protein
MPAPDVAKRNEALLDAMKGIAKVFGKADEFHLFREYLTHLQSQQSSKQDTTYIEEEFRREVPYWVKELVLPLAMLYDVGYADGVKVGKGSS